MGRGARVFVLAIVVLASALPALALEVGDRLVWELREEGEYGSATARVVVVVTGVGEGWVSYRVEDASVEGSTGILAFMFSLALGGEFNDTTPEDPLRACSDLAFFAPGVDGEFRGEGVECEYRDGVLAWARVEDEDATITARLVEGPGGGRAAWLLVAVAVAAAAILFILYYKKRAQ